MPSMGADDDKIGGPTFGLFNDFIANTLGHGLKNDEFRIDFGSGLRSCRDTGRQYLFARLAHGLLKVGKRICSIHKSYTSEFRQLHEQAEALPVVL